MVLAPRCRPGARGLLALLLLLLLPLPGARGLCGALPKLDHASPHGTSRTEDFSIHTQVTYRCRDGFVKIPGKSDTVVCLENSEWSPFGEFCNGGCGAPPRLKSATLSKEDGQKNYCPPGSTVSYVCRPGYESTEVKPVVTCLENLTWSEAPEFCRGKSCGFPKGPEHGRAVVITNDLYGGRANIICDKRFRLRGRPFIQCLPKEDQVEWSQLPTCQDQCGPQRRLRRDTNGKELADMCGGGSVKSLGTCDSPPRLSFAELPGVVNNSYPNGTELKYSCRPGYVLGSGKSPLVTCLANSTWSVDPEFCVGRLCKQLELENGRVDLTDLRFGATANFSCKEGYRLIGTTSAQCVVAGNGVNWDKELPHCQGIPCKQLELENGRVYLTDHQVGATANFSCSEGYRLIGMTSAQCVVAGNGVNWDKELPHCQAIHCLPPPDIANGSHTGQSEQEFSFGSAVTYKCDQGFSLIGEASIHCTTKDNVNGEWSWPAPKCKRRLCKQLELENGRVDLTDLRFGATANFSCDEGYRLIGTTSAQCVVAGNGLNWDKRLPHCQGIPCKQLELENGRVHLMDHWVGATANFSCNEGYRLIGTTSVQCVAVGNGVNWDKELPHCQVIITQEKPTTVPPEGAEVTGTSSVTITQDKPTAVPPEGTEVAGTSSDSALNTAGNSAEPEVEGPGIDTYIIGIIIAVVIVVIIIVIIIVILIGINNIGILTALNKIWQKKKGFYSVNPGCPKHQITTEHDSHLNESKCNLIFKV